jgi:hypothetical protein
MGTRESIAMAGWWTELWSIGNGLSRTSCGIARTEEGFAVHTAPQLKGEAK